MQMNVKGFKVRVWDLPLRLFHWLLAGCVIALVVTGKVGGGAMLWHERLGYAVLALLLFRLVWGFAGGRWARFWSFLYAPRSILAYLHGQPRPEHLVGHNPLGAASVFAMLLVLAVQVGTGLVSDDEIAFTGPLNRFVDSSLGLAATSYHKDLGQLLILVLVALHVAALVFYRLRGSKLVGPMVTGDKQLDWPAPASRDDAASRLAGAVVFAISAAVATWVASLGG